ncbi:A/G-specific adenine glycosylase [Buchnera aphidicola]
MYKFNFSRTIINWFHKHGRKNLPWQIKKNIFKTWISEIMLQQTQVKTVIPYFKKFIKKFPNIKKLSNSSLDEILFLWSGLGFYNRAKNIYKTSQIIKKKYNNIIPDNFYHLLKFPGIGKSTAGAILSLTFNYFFPILDGNVKRILKRFYNIKKKYQLEQKLWKKINFLTPIHNSQKFNQSMMDLGKIVCKIHQPICKICPLKKKCLTYIKKIDIKKNKKSKIKKIKKCWFIILKYKNLFYLKKQKYTIWNNLYYFPMFYKKKKMLKWIKKKKINFKNKKKLKKFLHHFSHYSLLIKVIIIKIKKIKKIKNNKIWFNFNNPKKIGIPIIVKKIFFKIYKKNKI